MFNKQNFCHIASNNRNEKKAGVFVYKTTDDLTTVSASGYFNDKIIDINLHDLIIHEWHDATDRTKVQRNVLCVIERTLDNVGTVVIKSKWEVDIEGDIEDIEQEIEDLETYVNNTFVKLDGTSIMTAPLKFQAGSMRGAVGPYLNGVSFWKMDAEGNITNIAHLSDTQFTPVTDNAIDLGNSTHKWKTLYIGALNNGYDIAVPVTNSADTLALKSEVDLAANSGDQLYTTGVWYAKMYAATVVPTGAEYDGRNYADFSQVDNDNNPIIVIYEGQSGAWVQIATITPPATYNGYMTITSKIWDIPEQAGQQGGKVLWSHNQKTFTPYPLIISFDGANITNSTITTSTFSGEATLSGNSTVTMPATPTADSIASVDFVLNHTGAGHNIGDIFYTSRTDSGLNGAVECNGATYQTTDFIGTESIGALLEAGKLPYVSLSTYASQLSTNGSVGTFGWDGAGTTAFRVPSLTNIFLEAGTAAQAGTYIAAGVPNITGGFIANNSLGSTPSSDGAFYLTDLTTGRGWDGSANMRNTYRLDASRSNSIYGNSNTVQPKAIKYRPMVQLAIGTTDAAVATVTSVTADVAALNMHRVIEFQEPTAQNNYTWYRKYADGWVEQGGEFAFVFSNSTNSTNNRTLLVPMADPHYNVAISGDTVVQGQGSVSVGKSARYTTTVEFYALSASNISGTSELITWQVSGMGA